MAGFPALKTGAVAQYPAERQISYRTQVVEFVDGTTQRYRDYGSPLRRWVIRLDLLDETELRQMFVFFEQAGMSSPFSFTDPWDGTVYPLCVADGFQLSGDWGGHERGRTKLVVREVRR